ncbi:MAG: DUF6893 family small protein [Acidimicrobiales bacterium]
MEIVGWIALAFVGLLVLVGIVFLLTSVPDLNRYRRLRRM